MALILNLETSTKNCSVGISKNGVCIALKEQNDGQYSHAEKLHVFIEELLNEHQLKVTDLDAIAVGKGPGSYTGLRIGVSAAKGLAYAAEIPLISVHTLQVLANTVKPKEGLIIPILDARRMEVYAAIFTNNHQFKRQVQAEIIDQNSYGELLDNHPIYFVGDAVDKCKEVLQHPNAIFIENQFPSAKEMSALSYAKFINKDFEDVAYFEPFYLKDFIVTPSKK
ncbi:tRNA (adenosine(37)-N6)-threonylcarbamoyltransferase complex dimerization subunit type 1 TsaB [Ochrovirga pacifica]|uniref:tRNA (adenosine(37)-N6)-threonylcarbamoyltransferase complex dimerization subunit type 1 TsaB n=1 Tax=Ochrovirga pacifica TaxID=1042376 RepID=UPI000255A50E|nr:tRNA (adenosine(37)-N6)-threonylcarbamoyltransferase complex dimerization subunit type 1 TsaB [Ochrovirga pacifica]